MQSEEKAEVSNIATSGKFVDSLNELLANPIYVVFNCLLTIAKRWEKLVAEIEYLQPPHRLQVG